MTTATASTETPDPAYPIRVSPDGRYFVDAAGRPFFWLGDTAWPLVSFYTPDQAVRYLDDRAARGFTVIQCVATWGQPDPVTMEGTPPAPNTMGELPWRGSAADPNPAFFENVDSIARQAADRGLALAMMPTWGCHVHDLRIVDAASAYAYGRWLGERYREQPNIVWLNGGDRDPTGFEDVWRAQGRGLRDGDGGKHLITYHPCGWRSSAYYFHGEEWLDFNMIETWTAWDKVYPSVRADREMLPPKPVVLGEGAYEDGPEYPQGPITPLLMRRQAWWAFTAGGSVTYGQNQMWRMEPGWLDALESPGAQQMRVFRQVATSRRWWEMIPDQGLYATGVSSERTLNTALRAIDRSGAMLYLSHPCHFVVHTDRIATPRVRATWVDPRNGQSLDAGEYPTGNRSGTVFPEWKRQCFDTPPYWEDAVLILDGVG